jgi:phosphoglycerol transferase MdoB-like AlkP superfamily enzyme
LPEFSNSIGRFRVPIFFYSPKEILKEKSLKNIQQIDVMPSILSLLNYPKPFLAFGKNVFSQSENNFAVNHFGEYQWHSNKFVMQFEGDKPKGLFRPTGFQPHWITRLPSLGLLFGFRPDW